MTDIFELAYRALDLTTKAGADEAEIYCVKGKAITVDIQRDAIDLAKESLVSGIGIRAIVKGAVGFSSTNDAGYVREAAELAVKSARVRGGDPEWTGLPEKRKIPHISDIYDRNIVDLEIGSCINYAYELIEGGKAIPSVLPTSGNFSCSSSTTLILNSHGIEIKENETNIQGSMDIITKDAPFSTASEFDMSRKLDLDFHKIGERASQLASRSRNGKSIETEDTCVLLEPIAFSDILENTLLTSIDSDNVQKGRSSLIGKMGTLIADENFSIIDDGTLPGGMGTASTDDEGTPSQRTEILKNGILMSYLYDCYTAGKENRDSTGNAIRGSYTSTPSIGSRNVIIMYPSFDIIEDTRDGVIVNSVIGAHTANPISGDFSVEARNSFLIKNGEIVTPIKSLMISGNIFEILKNIDGAGRDVRKVGNIITPTVRVAKMKIVGQ